MDLTLQLNARLRPNDRGDLYENRLDEYLKKEGIGECIGGGTMQLASGEIEYCDVNVSIEDSYTALDTIQKILKEIGVPKGSLLYNDEVYLPVGDLEGMAIYLNGVDLLDNVYDQCDINQVISDINIRIENVGSFYSYWEGPMETALYFYGSSFYNMRKQIQVFVKHHPLCQKCRIEQIA